MAVNFPDSPSNGDTTVINGATYTWDGVKWDTTSIADNILATYNSPSELPTTGLTNGDVAWVAGATNGLYISNGTGWLSIALTNQPLTITQGGAGSYILATDGTPTVITLTATDPEGLPITWSYTVSSGSLTNGGGTTATITQADNVFTITPTTTEAYAGTFSLTFTASDGINNATDVNSFSLVFVTVVDNSGYTSLLLQSDATSTNDQVDASSNSHTIAETGNITSTALTPYHPKGYSVYLDGTGDYFRTGTSAGMDFGTGDFTIEFWINQSLYNSGDVVVDGRAVWNDNGWSVETKNNGIWFYSSGVEVLTSSGTDFSTQTGQWIHVAIVRNSGTVTTYINGTSEGSVSYSTSINTTNANIYIGRRTDGNTGYDFNGYIADLRIVSSAVYTTDFTPPTERLTAITNTELLTCHAPYISDGSSNSLSTAISGNTKTVQFSPFDHDPYSKLEFGGSVYFDGNGDYMSIPANDAFSFGSSDFTIEAWVYVDIAGVITSNIPIVGWDTGSYKIIRLNSSGINVESNSPSNVSFTAAFPEQPVTNVWNHIAIVRSGNSFTAYLNGKGGTPYTYSGNVGNGTDQLNIGYKSDPAYYQGWMADLRIVKGTAVYTSDFVPPTAPLTAISGTSLLTCTNKHEVWDAATGNTLDIVGNTTASTSETKYANSSLYFDGNGDYIRLGGDFSEFFDGSFTIEFWVNLTSASSSSVISLGNGGGVDGLYLLHGGYGCYLGTNGTWNLISGSVTGMTTGTWHHFALTWDKLDYRIFVDGALELSATSSAKLGPGPYTVAVGATYNGAQPTTGYVEDVRFTKGLARYTANFTPPTESLEG